MTLQSAELCSAAAAGLMLLLSVSDYIYQNNIPVAPTFALLY